MSNRERDDTIPLNANDALDIGTIATLLVEHVEYADDVSNHSPTRGRVIKETDTDTFYIGDGSTWVDAAELGGSFGSVNTTPLSTAPSAPANGDIAYADGTGWNPLGDGTAGFFGYEEGAWVKL